MRDIIIYIAAAFFEISGCFAFWMTLRLHKTPWWILPGVVSLMIFAWLLTLVRVDFAGRAYAVYGGIYIIASFLWLFFAEQQVPDRWDVIGGGLCIAGVSVILFMPR